MELLSKKEKGSSRAEWVVFIGALVFFGFLAYNLFFAKQVIATLIEVERDVPIGLITVVRSDEFNDGLKHAPVMAKYISLVGDDVTIGWSNFYPSPMSENRQCGDLITVAPIYRTYYPKQGSYEAGEKVYTMLIGLTGVGEMGCETGTVVFNPEYDPEFKPFASAIEIWNYPNCLLRLWTTGKTYKEMSCLQSGFYPTDNWVRQGAVPKDTDSGMYVVFTSSKGLRVDAIGTADLSLLISYFQLDPILENGVTP